ncbi:hypothetical protein [Halosimplex amylolyticum]|uniref:hypothetical protein n=1 Tax=Halosimplex amylolyticum TaxID=3396616 RepID=UPI003F569B90
MPDAGGLVTTEEYRTGTPATGEYGAAGSPASDGTSGMETYGTHYSVFDEWFERKPYNREDVIVFCAVLSVAILAYAETR